MIQAPLLEKCIPVKAFSFEIEAASQEGIYYSHKPYPTMKLWHHPQCFNFGGERIHGCINGSKP
jgi:hypothetical protein